MKHRRTSVTPTRRHERGLAMALGLFTMATLMMAAATAAVVGSANIHATRNFRGASQAHLVAESAISEAMQRINGPGVIHFGNDVANRWSAVWGTRERSFQALDGFRYSALVTATVGDEANSGRIVGVAEGPEGSRRAVVATVVRSNIPATAPGALYLATDDDSSARFSGNNFLVDGNDRNYTGGAGPAAPVPGISTRNDTNTQDALDSLGREQLDNVQGLNFQAGPPTVASVVTSPAAPSESQLQQIVADLLSRPGVQTFSDNRVNGNTVFGTEAAPQITYFDNADEVTFANGTASGAGIMIVRGNLNINGGLDFKGLVIVLGDTTVSGDATIYGSVWTSDIYYSVGGSAILQYSSQALTLANQVGGGGALPSPILVTSLADCGQLPAGAAGCP